MYVCWGGVCGCGCDCVGVIGWVRKGVCGWNSLDCCLKVYVCKCRCVSGEGGVCVCVCVCVKGDDCVGVTVWV